MRTDVEKLLEKVKGMEFTPEEGVAIANEVHARTRYDSRHCGYCSNCVLRKTMKKALKCRS